MDTIFIDEEMARQWNLIHDQNNIKREYFWEACRELENYGIVKPDRSVISTLSIGPFQIALEDPKRKSYALFFFEKICPFLFATTAGMSFEDAYGLLILPVIGLFAKLLDSLCFITDELQWKVLLYIKEKNKNNIYPIKENIYEQFSESSQSEVDKAINDLGLTRNVIGDEKPLIKYNITGGLVSIV